MYVAATYIREKKCKECIGQGVCKLRPGHELDAVLLMYCPSVRASVEAIPKVGITGNYGCGLKVNTVP